MDILDKVECPKCKRIGKAKHCKSKACAWYFCHCVGSSEYRGIAFDAKNRYFYAKGSW